MTKRDPMNHQPLKLDHSLLDQLQDWRQLRAFVSMLAEYVGNELYIVRTAVMTIAEELEKDEPDFEAMRRVIALVLDDQLSKGGGADKA